MKGDWTKIYCTRRKNRGRPASSSRGAPDLPRFARRDLVKLRVEGPLLGQLRSPLRTESGEPAASSANMPHDIRTHRTGYSRLRPPPPAGDAGRYPLCPDSRPWQDFAKPIRDYQTLMSPLFRFLADGKEHNLPEATKTISDEFDLTRKTSRCITALCHPATYWLTGNTIDVDGGGNIVE